MAQLRKLNYNGDCKCKYAVKMGKTSFCLNCCGKIPPFLFSGRDRTRELVRIRDNQKCQDCKKGWQKEQRRLDIHHLHGLCGKKSVKYDKISEMQGLITLCHKCHFHRHDFSAEGKKAMLKKSYPQNNN